MAGALIFLIFSFILFYFLTREVWVRIIKEEEFKIEIHLPILSIHLKSSKNKKKKRYKESQKLSVLSYFRIINKLTSKFKDYNVFVKKVVLPIKLDNFDNASIIRPLRQQAFFFAFVAYLRTKVKSLILLNNAIILSPDVKAFQCYLTVKLRIYQLIYGLIAVRRALIFENEQAKGNKIYVREQNE